MVDGETKIRIDDGGKVKVNKVESQKETAVVQNSWFWYI